MSTNKSGAVRTSVARVQTGIELCEDNAKRFLQNATILLDHGGSDGLANVLWSFAVEEFGKAILDNATLLKFEVRPLQHKATPGRT